MIYVHCMYMMRYMLQFKQLNVLGRKCVEIFHKTLENVITRSKPEESAPKRY